jgi:cytochrome c-type biogenesis protein CcmH/NrfG
MSAKDKKAAGNSNRPNAQCQRGVSRAQQLLMVALACIVIAGVVILSGIWPQEEAVIAEPAPVAPTLAAPPAEDTPPSSLPEPVIPCFYPAA